MKQSSDQSPETARNPHGWLLQRLRDDTNQTEAARAIGVHKSTVNRLINEHAESLFKVMALAGLQVVDAGARTISEQELAALQLLAERGLRTYGSNPTEA